MMVTGALTFAGCGGGDNISTARVPNDVLDEFYDMYPTAENVDWKLKDNMYEADFNVGGKDMKAVYTPDGDFVRVDT